MVTTLARRGPRRSSAAGYVEAGEAGFSGLRLGDVRVLLAEAVDAAGDVHDLVLARVERMAVRADVGGEAPARGASDRHGPAGAGDGRGLVRRVDTRFHGTLLG